MDLNEIGLKDVYWIYVAQDRDQSWNLVSMIMVLEVLLKVDNFLTPLMAITFSRRSLFHGVSYTVVTHDVPFS
jgi:hypothetical protein